MIKSVLMSFYNLNALYSMLISCLITEHLILNCRHGPPVCFWTMRYEVKHSYFKRLVQSLGNFINLPYTLAWGHQEYQCYLHNSNQVFMDDIELGPGLKLYILNYLCNVIVVGCVGSVVCNDLPKERFPYAASHMFQ